ncbi:dTDP-glucose 4,6-dehydratase [Coraliomargarita parva]|uniref:dTDP-glucose 4,6-dehydratase n=1 Tax=Coraliomargarita parva TaxID=3014050 RepID=UPI0022B40F69|nr:dTDP-glucose 4,6-dehydratase [Coraliomargarita parva]
MRILVTGGSGFIGSHFVRYLLKERGDTVLNLDKLSYAAQPEALADLETHPRYRFIQWELGGSKPAGSLLQLLEEFQPDAICHLAAESHVDRSIAGPAPFIQSNIVGSYELLEAALAYWQQLGDPTNPSSDPSTPSTGSTSSPQAGSGQAASRIPYPGSRIPHLRSQLSALSLPGGTAASTFRFLQVSTDEVYGALQPGEPAFTEADAFRPNSPYSASKAAADHLARAWAQTYGLPVLRTHCGNNYGPGQHPEKLIPRVIECCLNGTPIPVYGSGEQLREWIHVRDHVEGLDAVLRQGQPGESYNLGSGEECRNLDLIRRICRLVDEFRPGKAPSEALIRHVDDRPGHDFRYALDSRHARQSLNWQARIPFETGLRETVAAAVGLLEGGGMKPET